MPLTLSVLLIVVIPAPIALFSICTRNPILEWILKDFNVLQAKSILYMLVLINFVGMYENHSSHNDANEIHNKLM